MKRSVSGAVRLTVVNMSPKRFSDHGVTMSRASSTWIGDYSFSSEFVLLAKCSVSINTLRTYCSIFMLLQHASCELCNTSSSQSLVKLPVGVWIFQELLFFCNPEWSLDDIDLRCCWHMSTQWLLDHQPFSTINLLKTWIEIVVRAPTSVLLIHSPWEAKLLCRWFNWDRVAKVRLYKRFWYWHRCSRKS